MIYKAPDPEHLCCRGRRGRVTDLERDRERERDMARGCALYRS